MRPPPQLGHFLADRKKIKLQVGHFMRTSIPADSNKVKKKNQLEGCKLWGRVGLMADAHKRIFSPEKVLGVSKSAKKPIIIDESPLFS